MQGVLADSQPGLVLWTDGSRDENGLVGYAVVWRKGGRKSHMGFFQEPEAHDAECAAICARPSGGSKLGRVRIRTSRDHADDLRRARAGPDLCP